MHHPSLSRSGHPCSARSASRCRESSLWWRAPEAPGRTWDARSWTEAGWRRCVGGRRAWYWRVDRGGGYPADALSRGHVGDVLAQESWLQYYAIEPICILDLAEVEILESLHEAGKSPGWLLARWKRSGLWDVGFKDFVVKEVDPDLPRPARMSSRVEDALAAAAERLTGKKMPADARERLRLDS